jgi:hypothetical protein
MTTCDPLEKTRQECLEDKIAELEEIGFWAMANGHDAVRDHCRLAAWHLKDEIADLEELQDQRRWQNPGDV